ncbi:patatin-like phospholipase family protein [Jeotgalibaca caeni]|uniref:patatin-like phospholipase family protein n=1 Tax=Jeotgalibaca caeni TaxID=3028623 RepID=UPI00237DC71E|nr:patatin family protein [Jeotgalibaca caeni]MDE1549904.1 patatin family protein [Jeotgalibaca caeni]
MSVGLVLEGGGMRGLYTAGVLDYFIEEGIEVDGMVTVSAGALFGINYASKQHGRTLRYNKQYIQDKRYISVRSLLRTGDIVNKDFAYYRVPFELDKFDQEAFEQSGIDFYATLTNVKTGEPEYIQIKEGFEQIEALRASGSMPFVSKMVPYQGELYLDGGVSDSIPFKKAQKLGYKKLIVILTRPLDYRKTKSNTRIIDFFYRQYPEFAKRLKNRYQNYNDAVEEIIRLEEAGEVFVIRPTKLIPMKRLEQDPEKLQEMYDLGMHDAKNEINKLNEFLRN